MERVLGRALIDADQYRYEISRRPSTRARYDKATKTVNIVRSTQLRVTYHAPKTGLRSSTIEKRKGESVLGTADEDVRTRDCSTMSLSPRRLVNRVLRRIGCNDGGRY